MLQIALDVGPTTTMVQGTVLSKFVVLGGPVVAVGKLLDACPENVCLVGPTAKGLLPGLFKMKDHKEVEGVGMCHKLEVRKQCLSMQARDLFGQDMEGRKKLEDKDIVTLEPMVAAPPATGGKADGKEDGKVDGKGGVGGGGESAAGPASAPAGSAATERSSAGPAAAGEEGEAAPAPTRPASVAHQTQCCGTMKSGVCNLI